MQIIDDHYHMEHRSIAKRSITPSDHHQRRLNDDNRVAWSEQQRAKSRQKRDFLRLKPTRSISKLLNDPKWSSMWYLNVSIVIDIDGIYYYCNNVICSVLNWTNLFILFKIIRKNEARERKLKFIAKIWNCHGKFYANQIWTLVLPTKLIRVFLRGV